MSEPNVAVASADTPSVDEQAAGQASAAAGASAVLADQAGQAAAVAAESATVAVEAAAQAGSAEGAAEAAQAAAADAEAARSQVESFIESQTALNRELVERLAAKPEPAGPPVPEAGTESKPEPDRAPERREHWINRKVGSRR